MQHPLRDFFLRCFPAKQVHERKLPLPIFLVAFVSFQDAETDIGSHRNASKFGSRLTALVK